MKEKIDLELSSFIKIFFKHVWNTRISKQCGEKKHGRSLWKSSLTALLPAPLSVKTATQTWPSSVVNGQDNSISEISPYYQGRWFYQHWLGGQWFLLYNKLSNLPKSATHTINQVFNKILRTFVANRLRHNQGKEKKNLRNLVPLLNLFRNWRKQYFTA